MHAIHQSDFYSTRENDATKGLRIYHMREERSKMDISGLNKWFNGWRTALWLWIAHSIQFLKLKWHAPFIACQVLSRKEKLKLVADRKSIIYVLNREIKSSLIKRKKWKKGTLKESFSGINAFDIYQVLLMKEKGFRLSANFGWCVCSVFAYIAGVILKGGIQFLWYEKWHIHSKMNRYWQCVSFHQAFLCLFFFASIILEHKDWIRAFCFSSFFSCDRLITWT